MESPDIAAAKKQVKEQTNLCMKRNKTEDESFQRIRNLFLQTEEMKEVSVARNKEMENRFKELQERISSSSGFLNQIKKSIENIKFSYQRDIINLERVTEENRDDIDRQIEEIRAHITKLKSKAPKEEPKPQTYQEAFSNVLTSFHNIAQEKYKSHNMK